MHLCPVPVRRAAQGRISFGSSNATHAVFTCVQSDVGKNGDRSRSGIACLLGLPTGKPGRRPRGHCSRGQELPDVWNVTLQPAWTCI